MELEFKSEKDSLLEAMSLTQELIIDNVSKQQALMIEQQTLVMLEQEGREEVKTLKMYIDILKENPLQDEEIANEYRCHITELEHQLTSIGQMSAQIKELHLEINDLKRSRSRAESTLLGYRQKLQNIEYAKTTKGKDYFIQRAAMSISEAYLKSESKENIFKRITSFTKDIFKK